MIWICWFYRVMTSVWCKIEIQGISLWKPSPPFPCNVVIEPIHLFDQESWFRTPFSRSITWYIGPRLLNASDSDFWYISPPMRCSVYARHGKAKTGWMAVINGGTATRGWNSVGSWALLLRRQYCLAMWDAYCIYCIYVHMHMYASLVHTMEWGQNELWGSE